MTEAFSVLLILAPAGLWFGSLALRTFNQRQQAGAVLGAAWYGVTSLAVCSVLSNGLDIPTTVGEPTYLNVSISQILAQAMLFGAVLHLYLGRVSLVTRSLVALIGHLALAVSPVVPASGVEALPVALVLWCVSGVPALLLANWTTHESSVVARSLMQNTVWAAVLLWLLPGAVIDNGFGQWPDVRHLVQDTRVFMVLAMILPIGLLSLALGEFAVRGSGTGFPFDPPKRLVTTGVYAYLSNPMQLGICSLMVLWGGVLNNLLVMAMGAVAWLLFGVFKNVCNGSFAIGTRDPEWRTYQDAVPRWLPRRTPYSSLPAQAE